ncbi:MAG: T9SS type A sorting domain-containing protein [Candidatus Cloacimonetes bacterium]|nr:T9SS type A sorting domain-containing protein [Candidatus Cloacimonadota bacterium]
MKKIIFFLIFFLPSLLSATIYEVKQDGTGDFITIQEGINASTDGDTVLVYPGIYYENIDYLEKSITVASLYLFSQQDSVIHNTILDGNQSGSVVFAENVTGGYLIGFTIKNGTGTVSYIYCRGGGLHLRYSTFQVNNCIITNNIAKTGGGIIIFHTTLSLSKTDIIRNHATERGGGILIGIDSNIIFDSENLCNIYLNTATQANDICLSNLHQNIVVDTFTVMEPDNFFICDFYHTTTYDFSVQNAIVEPVNADLYVSPAGSDDNNGLTLDDPLQTIFYALIKIEADSLNPHTIYLADGIYSPSLNNQRLPLNMKAYVSLIGESEENTIIDGDEQYGMMAGWDEEKGVKLKNLTCQNGYFQYHGVQVLFYYNTSIEIENLTIKNCYSLEGRHQALIMSSYHNTVKNLTIEDCRGHYILYLPPVRTYAENIKVTGTLPNGGASSGGALFSMSNTSIVGEPSVVVNLEITDNLNNEDEWPVSAAVLLSDRAEAVFVNATIASNNCIGNNGAAITLDSSTLTLINSIVYGNNPRQVHLTGCSVYGPDTLTVQNSLIQGGEDDFLTSWYYELNWLDGNIDEDPQFIGEGNYPYALSDSSPCIDAGTTELPEGIELPEYDLAGNPRIYGETVDMGAYEWQDTVSATENIIPDISTTQLTIYPNPFSSSDGNPSITVALTLNKSGNTKVEIYNIKGQKIKTLMSAYASPGKYEIIWDGKDNNSKQVSSGIYFYKLIIANKIVYCKKCLFLR